MRNLIKKIQARHKTQSEVMAHKGGVARFRLTYLEIVTHQDRGDLLAVIKSIGDLCDESVLKGNVMEFADSRKAVRADAIKALLNGDAP